MEHSNDKSVAKWLEDIRTLSEEKYAMLQSLRSIIQECYPTVKERIMYGGIMFSFDGEDFSGLFVRNKHISLEFGFGYRMSDPNHFLEGKGKYRRHLKLYTIDDINSKTVLFFVKQSL